MGLQAMPCGEPGYHHTRAHNNPVLFVIPTVQISNFKINLKGERVYSRREVQNTNL
jgi:hypothetical protein